MINDFDWTLVLQPLSGDNPCGVDVQYDPAYDNIRRARQAEADVLPAGVWERQSKKIDWPSVGRLCYDMLVQRSKDLQVAAWLIEALVRTNQLEGMAKGVTLFSELVETFWDEVYPQLEIEDNGQADAGLRLRAVDWLLREGLKWFNLGLLAAPDAHALLESDRVTRHMHLQTIETQLTSLEIFLDTKIPGQTPTFRELVSRVKTERVASAPAEEVVVDGANPVSAVTPTASRHAVYNRDTAYDQLREIANFLDHVEPHSPVPTILKALVGWRDTRFEDLLLRLPQQGGLSIYELLKLFKSSEQQ